MTSEVINEGNDSEEKRVSEVTGDANVWVAVEIHEVLTALGWPADRMRELRQRLRSVELQGDPRVVVFGFDGAGWTGTGRRETVALTLVDEVTP